MSSGSVFIKRSRRWWSIAATGIIGWAMLCITVQFFVGRWWGDWPVFAVTCVQIVISVRCIHRSLAWLDRRLGEGKTA